ncbi:sugar phosphate isomerase/epimerase family protein [Lichenifustis flavocetrariae]|uniref:Sugar phosphate isomerase/epimerase n=1 Tax=Lichenifustis flavocetrariae TaxID=2949735 RepID=A0AA41Z0S4_9HYPH|nr:TIM barrel protein [Lichenifustis flavocetrariae]MCW6508423.1 sugar phosphate isomerase/epimerase [Lichenifustis flavocetrariae]
MTPLGIAHFTTIELPPAELVSMAGRVGYAFVGLRLFPAAPGAPLYAVPHGSLEAKALHDAMERTGVAVRDLEFVVIGPEFDAAALAPVLDAASAFGAKRVSCCGADPERARLVANLAALCDVAAQHGMGVDLECMAWRDVASLGDAAAVMREVGRPTGGVLVDALHLSRTGGTPADVAALPPAFIRSAQLCDAPARSPPTMEGIIAEARGGRLPPGEGALPLRELLAALPPGVALSVEVPMDDGRPAEDRARDIFDAARRLLEAPPP